MDAALYEEMFRLESKHWWFRAKHEIVAALLDRYVLHSNQLSSQGNPISPPGRPKLADLGCGCGMLISKLQSRYEVIGLDGSSHAARLASERGLKIEVGQLPGPTPLPSSAYDAVTILDVLEHLDDDTGTVIESIRLLKPGGVLIVTVPAHQWLWTRRDELHHHRRRYSKREFRRLFQHSELDLRVLTYINSVLFPIAVVERLYRKARPVNSAGDLNLPPAPLNWLLGKSFSAERHLIGRIPLPPGLSLLAIARKKELQPQRW